LGAEMHRGIILLSCAWVMWLETGLKGHPIPSDISPVNAYDTKHECLDAIPATLHQIKGSEPGATIKGHVLTRRTAQGTTVYILSCFPDTVDPRRPK
jgi:hypothetical protein